MMMIDISQRSAVHCRRRGIHRAPVALAANANAGSHRSSKMTVAESLAPAPAPQGGHLRRCPPAAPVRRSMLAARSPAAARGRNCSGRRWFAPVPRHSAETRCFRSYHAVGRRPQLLICAAINQSFSSFDDSSPAAAVQGR